MACRLMDEGLAEWEMPIKKGFYNACKLAVYDTDMPKTTISETKNKNGGTSCNHGRYSSTDFTKIFTSHLAALPWTDT
jgi:hypothetical protein